MKLFSIKNKISSLQKICLSGVLIVLIMLLQKVIAVNYVPGLPWVRLSFGGPALIIFSSIFLGPWYGLLIGSASDVIGYFFFDASGFGMMPQITAIYALLGFAPYFIFQSIKIIESKKLIIVLECACFAAFLGLVTGFLFTQSDADMWVKIAFPCGALVLTILLMVFIIFYNKRFQSKLDYNIYQISLFAFFTETLVMLAFGSTMKAWAFGFDLFNFIFMSQTLVLFFNVVMDTVVIALLMKATSKYMTYTPEK